MRTDKDISRTGVLLEFPHKEVKLTKSPFSSPEEISSSSKRGFKPLDSSLGLSFRGRWLCVHRQRAIPQYHVVEFPG